jgi:hypothetical protein
MSSDKDKVVVIGDFDEGDEMEFWRMEYTGTDGHKKRMTLDASTRERAILEASEYVGVDPGDVIVEYD